MPASHSTTPHAALAAFLNTAADQFAAMENAVSGSDSQLSRDLSVSDGITVAVSDGITRTATVTVDENAGLPFDFSDERPGQRSDFSAERLAQFDVAYEAKVKASVFSRIKGKAGRWSIEQINTVLAALDLGEVKTVTDVSYKISGSAGTIRRTLAGDVTLEQAKALLEETGLPRYSDAQLRADAAFGETGSNKTETTSYETMTVKVRNEWPSAPSAS